MEAKNERLWKEKKNSCPLRIFYLGKISFKIEGEIQTFSNIQKLKETSPIVCRPTLQEIVKEVLQPKKAHIWWKHI